MTKKKPKVLLFSKQTASATTRRRLSKNDASNLPFPFVLFLVDSVLIQVDRGGPDPHKVVEKWLPLFCEILYSVDSVKVQKGEASMMP